MGRRRFLETGLFAAGGLAILGPAAVAGCGGAQRPADTTYRPRYHTIAHEMLAVEQEHKSPYRHAADNRLLDLLIDGARARVVPSVDPALDARERAVATLGAVDALLGELGFRFREGGTLGEALRFGDANCDSGAAIYLAIGEVLELPLRLVRAPGHAFVRWELGSAAHVNWETTLGKPLEDEHYVRAYQIPAQAIGVSALRSLDPRSDRARVLANAYVNSGVRWLKKCEVDLARARFKQAFEHDPVYVAPYYNLGLTAYNEGDTELAVSWLEIAVRLNPNHLKSHAMLKVAHGDLGHRKRSLWHRNKVLGLDRRYYSRQRRERRRRRAAQSFCA